MYVLGESRFGKDERCDGLGLRDFRLLHGNELAADKFSSKRSLAVCGKARQNRPQHCRTDLTFEPLCVGWDAQTEFCFIS